MGLWSPENWDFRKIGHLRNFEKYHILSDFFVILPQRWKIKKKFYVLGEKMKKSFKFNIKYIELIPVKFSTTLIFSSRNFKFFQFLMNYPQRWKIRKILSVGWESEKNLPLHRNDPRQILYNFDFFVQELQICSIFDELST